MGIDDAAETAKTKRAKRGQNLKPQLLDGRELWRCCNCRQYLPATDFAVNGSAKRGLEPRCRDCNTRRKRQHYRRNQEAVKAASRAYYWANRAAIVAKTRKRRQEQPKAKQTAHYQVAAAVKRGDLERPAVCSICGSGDWIEAHHEDYQRALNVVWLCRSCHGQRHSAINRAAKMAAVDDPAGYEIL